MISFTNKREIYNRKNYGFIFWLTLYISKVTKNHETKIDSIFNLQSIEDEQQIFGKIN